MVGLAESGSTVQPLRWRPSGWRLIASMRADGFGPGTVRHPSEGLRVPAPMLIAYTQTVPPSIGKVVSKPWSGPAAVNAALTSGRSSFAIVRAKPTPFT